MTALEMLREISKIANEFKKEMTAEMIANSPKWQAFKKEHKEHFERVGYPQTVISDLSAVYARNEFNNRYG